MNLITRLTSLFAEARAPMGEVATTKDGRDVTRGYIDALPLLPPQDYILLGRAGGDYQVYEQIQTDPQVQTGLNQRKKALVSKEWEVIPGTRRGHYSKARAKQAADSLKAMLDDLGGESEAESNSGTEQAQPLPGWDAISEAMLHGIFPGYGVAECLYTQDGREVVLDRIHVRKPRRFAFAPNGALRLLTSANVSGEPVPRQKFWSFTAFNDCTDDPYGLGLAHWLYWPVYFKRADIRFWLGFLEKFGAPTGVGEFPVNATPAEKNKLLQAVRAIQSDSGIIVPQGMIIRLLEAARSGTADYMALHNAMDAAISKVIVGHSAAADATPGRLGGEDRANNVADNIIKADADLVCGSFNVSVARWLTAWNFGPDVPTPLVWRRVAAEQDLKPLAERDKLIMDLAAAAGQRLTAKYLTDTYGVELEAVKDPEDPEAPNAPSSEEGAETAPLPVAEHADPAADGQDLIDHEALRDPGYQAAMDILLKPIMEALDQGMTPEEILAKLPEWYGQMDDSALIGLLDLGVAAADAIGRLEVAAESPPEEGATT